MAAERVTVVGLGLMGSALTTAAEAAGLGVTVWNRSASKTRAFADGPARVASTIEEAIDASDIVVVCVRDYDATRAALRRPSIEERLDGKAIVQLSTGTPAQAGETAAWAAGVGASYLDGSIMGFPQDIGTDGLVVLYGGEQATFDRCSAVTAAFGGTAVRIGSNPGSAAALDNALLSVYFSFLFGVLSGAAICDAEGIPLDTFKEVGGSMMPIFGGILDRSVDMIASDSYESEHSTLETSLGAMSKIAAVVEDTGLDDRLIECMRTYATEAIEAGQGGLGNAILFKHLQGK